MNVSVVICTFNGAAYLAAQLRSIGQQTRPPAEVVIFDDQSTDATVALAQRVCAEQGLNYRLHINEMRLGVEQNFSRAMLAASGDVLFFCDQDDVWQPTKIAQMTAPFEADPAVTLVYSDGEIVGPELAPTGYTLFSKNPRKGLARGDARDVGAMLRAGHAPGIKASALAFSAQLCDWAGPLPDSAIAHDSWIAYLGYALGRVVVIPEPLYAYRRHAQTSGKSSSNQLIAGMASRQHADLVALLQEKAHLAACLAERCAFLAARCGSRVTAWPRFAELQRAAQEAARTLTARAQIVAQPAQIARLWAGSRALWRGDYVAVAGLWHKLQCLRHDVRGAT